MRWCFSIICWPEFSPDVIHIPVLPDGLHYLKLFLCLCGVCVGVCVVVCAGRWPLWTPLTTAVWSQNKHILLWFNCNKRIKRMEIITSWCRFVKSLNSCFVRSVCKTTNKKLLKCLFSEWSSDQSELCYANIVADPSTFRITWSKLGINTAWMLLFIHIDMYIFSNFKIISVWIWSSIIELTLASVAHCWRCSGAEESQHKRFFCWIFLEKNISSPLSRNQSTGCYRQPRKSRKVSFFKLRYNPFTHWQ